LVKVRARQRLKEKDHVVAARYRYLRAKRGNHQGDEVMRPEVYFDESSVNTNPSNDCIWYGEEDGPGVQKPPGQGERRIMAHLLEQLDDAFASVTEETCTGWIKQVREVEDKYWREDAQLDRGQ
jgi:hypothetical protein